MFISLVDLAAIARTVGHLSKSAEVMKLVNNLMKAPEVAITMQEFSKEMMKVFFGFSQMILSKIYSTGRETWIFLCFVFRKNINSLFYMWTDKRKFPLSFLVILPQLRV